MYNLPTGNWIQVTYTEGKLYVWHIVQCKTFPGSKTYKLKVKSILGSRALSFSHTVQMYALAPGNWISQIEGI